jgi:lipoprotein NlpD
MQVPAPGRIASLLAARVPLVALLCLTLLVGACGGLRKDEPPEYYTVRTGDTLYSIGWRHRLDYRDIARWNGIGRDYRIYVGQRLRLRPPPGGVAPRAPTRPPPPATVRPPPKTLPPAPPWTWPVLGGRVAGSVKQPSGSVGLRIDGALGQPVLAAADGKVVYTGTGLHGYGVVIIINHANGWLTAYGHNATVEVGEGDAVRAGQRIATMGEGVGQQPMLYFEIRIEGAPVDPLTQLPRR